MLFSLRQVALVVVSCRAVVVTTRAGLSHTLPPPPTHTNFHNIIGWRCQALYPSFTQADGETSNLRPRHQLPHRGEGRGKATHSSNSVSYSGDARGVCQCSGRYVGGARPPVYTHREGVLLVERLYPALQSVGLQSCHGATCRCLIGFDT